MSSILLWGRRRAVDEWIPVVVNDAGELAIISTQLPTTLTPAGNLRASIQEQAIAIGVDRQAVLNLRVHHVYTPAVAVFFLPTTGSIDLSNMAHSTWFVFATSPAAGGDVINAFLQASLDGGITWRRLTGFSLLNADIVRGQWASLGVGLRLAHTRLEIVCTGVAPAALEAAVIRGA